jgi:hypothetical protein
MKDARLGEFLLWDGKPAWIIAEASQRQVIIEMIEPCKCPHCQGDIGKKQISVIVASPMFQERAQPMKTITSDPTLTISE